MSIWSKFKTTFGKFSAIVAPYFSPRKQRERLKILAAYATVHILEFAVDYFFTVQAESEAAVNNPGLSMTTNFGNIIVSGGMYAFKIAMSNWIIHSLTESTLEANALEGWLTNEASIGIDFVQSSEQGRAFALSPDAPVERILTEHNKNFAKGTVKLTVENISRLISSAASLFVIGRLTNANTALLYFVVGGTLVTVCCKLDLKRIDKAFQVTKLDDTINARLTHIREHAPQILALQGAEREIAKINLLMVEKNKLAKEIFKAELVNNTILYVTFFGLSPLLSMISQYLPSLLQTPPSNNVGSILFQPHVFQLLINFFIAMENNTQEYPKFSASIGNMHNLLMLLTKWRQMRTDNGIVQHYSNEPGNLIIQNLCVNMPTRGQAQEFRALLENTSITLTPDEYQLLGASNAGKSTTFKAIMGLWPHASGTITYPCGKKQLRFTPQETFIPYDPTLLEMIIYPEDDQNLFNRDEIIELLRAFNLSHLIDTLDEKQDLRKLSRGEQQRIALIGAIVAKPKLLLMDEATASIDERNKINVVDSVRSRLPGTLVITIDHSPLHSRMKPVNEEIVVTINTEQEAAPRLVQCYASHFKPKAIEIVDKQLRLVNEVAARV